MSQIYFLFLPIKFKKKKTWKLDSFSSWWETEFTNAHVVPNAEKNFKNFPSGNSRRLETTKFFASLKNKWNSWKWKCDNIGRLPSKLKLLPRVSMSSKTHLKKLVNNSSTVTENIKKHSSTFCSGCHLLRQWKLRLQIPKTKVQ